MFKRCNDVHVLSACASFNMYPIFLGRCHRIFLCTTRGNNMFFFIYYSGVSNFGVEHLDALKNSGRPMPQVNQIQLHPWWRLQQIVDWCKENNVAVMGYSPLARCHTFGHPLLVQLAKNYNKSPAQILIRWSLQKGFVTIPKSNRSERIDENVDVFDFEICEEDMDKFEQLFETGEQINVCKSDPTNNDMVTKFGPLI